MRKLSRREFVVFSGALLGSPLRSVSHAQDVRTAGNLLSGGFPPERLASVLMSRENWNPFPTSADREGWNALPGDVRKSLIAHGEELRGSSWQPLPAVLFLEYGRNGNRSHYERVRDGRRAQLASLVLAECAQGEGRYLDDILNGIWATCEETFWGVPAHLGMQKAGPGLPDASEPIVDLFAAETSSLLSWTDYLLGPALDSVSPLVRPRIRLEIDRRILSPCMNRVDFWWMGLDPKQGRDLNNWTPWIASNWLATSLLVEANVDRRIAAVHKALLTLDRFLASYHPDGGCDEGPGYWFRAGGSLFDCLELLYSASRGAIDFYQAPLVREIGRYIYRAHISDRYFINFADAPAKVHIAGDLVFRYGTRIGDKLMEAFGAWAAEQNGWLPESGESIGRQLPALFNLSKIKSAPRRQPFVKDAWFPGIQVLAARRQEGSITGLYLAAQGGHNAESHNHNDVGNFIVYADGRPAVVDVGVETYTAKTFSSERYKIWTMQSAYHNLPTIGGVMQSAGRAFAASDVSYRADERVVELSLEIAHAYPKDANLDSWRRQLSFDRTRNQIELRDNYVLTKSVPRITETLMSACPVTQSAAGELTLDGSSFPSGKVRIIYDPSVFSASIEEIRIEDSRLKSSWGDRLYRILLTAEKPGMRDSWTLRIVQ
ncbi:MAG TPA: heparinase II/III family protein [Acidobacteriota bacterium]|nr:heparinase II/III family protein [Acidobacteriota bacterium]